MPPILWCEDSPKYDIIADLRRVVVKANVAHESFAQINIPKNKIKVFKCAALQDFNEYSFRTLNFKGLAFTEGVMDNTYMSVNTVRSVRWANFKQKL